MSDIAAETAGHRSQGAASPPAPQGYQRWRRVRSIGYILLGLQLLGYLVWSTTLYESFSVTSDYAMFSQSLYLIAHGDLAPFCTISGLPFLQNDAELYPYVLAPLYWIFHTGMVLRWAQDFSVAGAEFVAFTWICDQARRHCPDRDAAWLAGLGLLLFIANPWLWSSISFDVHTEAIAIFFPAFAAWDLSRGKRRAWVWAISAMLCGAPATSYVIAVGLGGVLAGRRTRRMGAALVAAGIAHSLLIALVHDDGVASSFLHSYIAQTTARPLWPIEIFWDQRTNIIANLSSGGLIGIGAPFVLPLVLIVGIPDTLGGQAFAEPLFQNVPIYVFLPVGTVTVLALLLRRHRPAALVLAGVVAAQAIGWAAVWGPQIPVQWLRVSSAESATLAMVQARIPASAEVIASQGVIGRFSERTYAYALIGGGGEVPLQPDTWFVITPTSGVETAPKSVSMALIAEVAGPLHAKLVTDANGVWAFRLTPPPGVTTITIPGASSPLPAWAGAGAASLPVLDGAVSNWHMAATGAKGYVSDGVDWMEAPGRYRAEVTLSASASASGPPVNVEVWDDNTNTLLARRALRHTDGIQRIVLPVVASAGRNRSVFGGWGPFRANFVVPGSGQRIEVRVWSPGAAAVNVYNAELTAAPGFPVPQIR